MELVPIQNWHSIPNPCEVEWKEWIEYFTISKMKMIQSNSSTCTIVLFLNKFCFLPCLDIYHSVICIVCLFSQELDEIRKSGMKNFRNIQVEESNLLSWQGLIVPVSSCFLLDSSEISWPTVSFANLLCSLPGQPSLWQRCVQDRNNFPHWVPFQASQDHIQDKDLSPQHWWEGPGVLACDQRRELEACHQNWPRWVC